MFLLDEMSQKFSFFDSTSTNPFRKPFDRPSSNLPSNSDTNWKSENAEIIEIVIKNVSDAGNMEMYGMQRRRGM